MVLISVESIDIYERMWGHKIYSERCSECFFGTVYATSQEDIDIWPVTCIPCFAMRTLLGQKEW